MIWLKRRGEAGKLVNEKFEEEEEEEIEKGLRRKNI
jgi:hypothetical protein